MTPKDQALKLAQQIKDMKATDEDRFAIAAILLSTGLGVMAALVKSGKIPSMRIFTVISDLKAWISRIQNDLTPH